MDRCGIFVDAGYLLAEVGDLCLGTKRRSRIRCDYSPLHEALRQHAQEHSGLAILRTYWYDGARNAVPTAEHLRIAALPNMKVRLGRLSGGKQKGVDSLMIRDLMTLARERAIATAYVLGGDEDLREGVIAAQDLGVQVVLYGIPGRRENQSTSLTSEADERLVLESTFWQPFFSVEHDSPEAPARERPTAPSPPPQSDPTTNSAADFGREFAASWASSAEPSHLKIVVQGLPVVPGDVDAAMLRAAERELGSLRERENERRAIRNGFVEHLRTIAENGNG